MIWSKQEAVGIPARSLSHSVEPWMQLCTRTGIPPFHFQRGDGSFQIASQDALDAVHSHEVQKKLLVGLDLGQQCKQVLSLFLRASLGAALPIVILRNLNQIQVRIDELSFPVGNCRPDTLHVASVIGGVNRQSEKFRFAMALPV